MSKEKPRYHCGQGVLYSVLETAWENYKKNLARFTAYKGKYTATTRTDALAAIAAAKAMPDDAVRSTASELARLDVVKGGRVCCQNFMLLEGYIDEVWKDEPTRAIQYKAAGKTHYAAAANGDWEEVDALNKSAKDFIAANMTALLGVAPNLNMPAAFATGVTAAATDFAAKYLAFKSAEETAPATGAKVKANNECHTTGMAMMADAQRIFINEPDLAGLFVFSTIEEMVDPKVANAPTPPPANPA